MHTIIIPELALDTEVFSPAEIPLDTVVDVESESIRLPFLEAYFTIL